LTVLIDTAVLLWFYHDETRLTALAHRTVADKANQVYVSAASYWEVAIKVSTGKLRLVGTFDEFIQGAIVDAEFSILPILPQHTSKVCVLPYHHRDPFDCILVAQALAEGMVLVSPDQALDAYGVHRIW
jgi:PIN domain nuclease of toxin-antitoxin system